MQILNESTVKQQLTMPMAIEAIKNLLSIQAQHSDWIKCPERLVIPTFTNSTHNTTGSHLSMPAVIYDGNNEHTVVKLVTICPDNPSRDLSTTTAVITVSDNATGQLLALMDGVYITQVRTAALSGIATKYLAKTDSHTVAVIGCGGMAYEQLNAVLTVRPNITQVNLWNRNIDKAHEFKAKFEQDYSQWSVNIDVMEDIDNAINNADIINLATRSNKGLFGLDAIQAHVHINAVGAYLPEMKEVSDDIIAACSHIIIDDIAGGRHEAGDLIQADNNSACAWTWDELTGDLKDLVTKDIIASANNTGITLFKSVGSASFDAAVALKIVKIGQEDATGDTVN